MKNSFSLSEKSSEEIQGNVRCILFLHLSTLWMFYKLKYSQCFQGFQIEEHFFRKMLQLVLVELEPLHVSEIVQRALLDGADLVVVQRSEKKERKTFVTKGEKSESFLTKDQFTANHPTVALLFTQLLCNYLYFPNKLESTKIINYSHIQNNSWIDNEIKDSIIMRRWPFVVNYLKTLDPARQRD